MNGRFRIGSTVYEASSILRLTLGQILDLERQTAALGRPLSWSQIKAMMQSLESVSAEAFSGHDDAPWVIALTIYASRLAAGEQVTFGEAVDFPLEDLTILPATEDHSRPGPTKARPGSGRAAAKPATSSARKTGSRSATR